MENCIPSSFGWRRDSPDTRDLWFDHETVKPLLAGLRKARGRAHSPAASVTWAEFFPPVDNQQTLAASTAHACAGLIQYFERRAHGRRVDGSCLFLHQMARQLEHGSEGSGATVRATLKALKRFGLPPREHWPYLPERRDEQPPAFLFSYAREYQELCYLRLDRPGTEGRHTLAAVKSFLAAGFPVMFGFTVFDSLQTTPEVPFPTSFDAPLGGQAVVASGYDDKLRIRSEKGALQVRSSWGRAWGDDGYGWLPYRYVADHLSADFWTVLRPDWLATGEFFAPG